MRDPGERLVSVPIPSLVSVLIGRADEKGSSLTAEEVVDAAENCSAIIVTARMRYEMALERGYHDLDPDDAWEEWQCYLRYPNDYETADD